MIDLILSQTVQYRVCRDTGTGWEMYLDWTESLQDALECLYRMRENFPEDQFKTQERYVSKPYETRD